MAFNPETVFFPYPHVRAEQEGMVASIQHALETKTHLIAHAPTGLGKTIAALGPAVKHAIDNDTTVFFLTSRHTQHAMALNTLRDIKEKFTLDFSVVDLIGKKGMCLQPSVDLLPSSDFTEYCKELREKNNCEFYTNTKGETPTVKALKVIEDLKPSMPCSTEHVNSVCKEEKLCPYETSIIIAEKAKVIIGDYYYIFHPNIRDAFFQKAKKSLDKTIVIVDEGHNLPERVRKLMTEQLSSLSIKAAVSEAKKFGHAEIIPVLQHLQEVLVGFSSQTQGNEMIITKETFMEKVNAMKDYEELLTDLDFIGTAIRQVNKRSFLSSLATFLEKWKGEEKGFTRVFTSKEYRNQPLLTLSYKCLDPALLTQDVIATSHSTILMSGTLNPPAMYRDILGFPVTTTEKSFASPFQKENQLSLVIPQTTTKFALRNEQQYKNMAKVCAEVVNAIPGNTAIFFPSYYLRDQVYQHFFDLTHKTIFKEIPQMSKQEKLGMLDNFKQYKGVGAVLMGAITGNFAEGIDLPGDLLKGVIVVGLPLQQPNLETKELIKYYDERFGKGWDYGYILPAFTRCLQGAGRCIRTEQDRGVVVFLDERYVWPRYAKCFPEGYGLQLGHEYEEKIKMFFSQKPENALTKKHTN
jgi:DNA excision repair protein ERCC-2